MTESIKFVVKAMSGRTVKWLR